MTRWPAPVLAGAAFLSSLAVAHFAHHHFDLSLDEFSSTFQAQIFAQGQIMADLSPHDAALAPYMQPFLVYKDVENGVWMSNYRPGYGALRGLFLALGLAPLLNPILAAVAVLATMDVARRIWPQTPEAALWAGLLLVATPQFIITAGSGFSYTAYLALHMVWLSLFLRRTLAGHVAAAFLGVFLIGLHQIHVHPLFAFPFCLALLLGAFGPRWHALIYLVLYLLALPVVLLWVEIATWLHTGTAIWPSSLADVRYLQDFFGYRAKTEVSHIANAGEFTATNLLRFAAWLSPALLVALFATLRRVRAFGVVPLLCGLAVLISVAAHHVLMPNQMQSWGARYYHPVLGALVIFAVAGVIAVRGAASQRLQATLAVLTVASVVVFLPWRAVQVDAKVGPRAEFQAWIETVNADYILLDPTDIFLGGDPVRNAPFLSDGPRILFAPPNQEFPVTLGGTVVTVDADDGRRFGVSAGTLLEPGNPPN